MKYRPEIDGLRAISVISVVLFHAGFIAFRGGFVGVDVFFVISGYLITSIVRHESQNKTYSILTFYERRVRRIIPALFVVIIFCMVVAWKWMTPSELTSFSESVIATILFCSNIYFYSSINYFSNGIDYLPLIHTWSLAVEEQFYLLFPLFAMLLSRYKSNILLCFITILAVVSLATAEWMSTSYPDFNFYMLPSRAWELGVGMIVALAPLERLRARGPLSEIGSIAGLSSILLSVTLLDEATPFPSVVTLAPVVGAALVIALGHGHTFCGRLLAMDPLVRIGLISYSAYLWHQPLFAFARIRLLPTSPSDTSMLLLSAAAFCLGYLSWRFVERPFRDRRRMPARPIAFAACATALALSSVAVAAYRFRGVPSRLPPSAMALWKEVSGQAPFGRWCFTNADPIPAPAKACDHHAEHARGVVLWGDSHSVSIALPLADRLSEAGFSLKQFTFGGCPPIVGVHSLTAAAAPCPNYNDRVYAYIQRHPELTTIILFARWPIYLNGQGYDNGEGGKISGGRRFLALPSDKGREFEEDETRVAAVGAILRANVEALLRLGRRVVLVYPTPEIGCAVPECMMHRRMNGEHTDISVGFAFFSERTLSFREQIDHLPKVDNLLRIEPATIFCNASALGRCAGEFEDKPLYRDDNHLNDRGASMLSGLIVAGMRSKGWL